MSPKYVSVLVGTAWLMWLAPAFHHGPPPLKAEAEARTTSDHRKYATHPRITGRSSRTTVDRLRPLPTLQEFTQVRLQSFFTDISATLSFVL